MVVKMLRFVPVVFVGSLPMGRVSKTTCDPGQRDGLHVSFVS